MAPTPASALHSKHLPWLDWCRFLAALMVVMVHARAFAFSSYGSIDPDQRHALTAVFYMLTRIGTQAVLIFFVLSGFLVGGKAIDRFKDGSFQIGNYVIDRCTRILVPFVPALVFTILAAHISGLESANTGKILGNLFFLQGITVSPYPGNEPLWSLSYEVWFYVLAGSCVILGARNTNKTTPLIIASSTLLLFTILSPVHLFCWIIGALAWTARPKTFRWPAIILGGVLFGCGMLGIQLFSEAQTASINDAFSKFQSFFISYEASQIVFCLGFALVIQQLILLPASHPRVNGIERMGTRLAAFSYTLYLIHNPILHLFHSLGLSRASRFTFGSVGLFLGIIFVSLAVSLIFYGFFEKHTSTIRRRIQTHFA